MKLVTRDSKNKIRVIYISLIEDIKDVSYTIKRSSGLLEGKLIIQPDIKITKGKVKRTVFQQAELQFNSEVKKLKDKGYKEISVNISVEEIDKFLGQNKTDSDGNYKPMLAKALKDCDQSKIDNKQWYISRKINGLRCTICKQNGVLHAFGRGSSTYDTAISHILNHPKLIEFFDKNPTIILDGECYKHGIYLQEISGKMRQESEPIPELEFYLYDIVDPSKKFTERLKLLQQIEKDLDLYFLPDRKWNDDDLKIQIVPQELVNNLNEINAKHDQFVSEGFEGAVIRDPISLYVCGGRNLSMVKVKRYLDDCFMVVGIQQGLRQYDDMVFVLKTKDNLYFNAKPMGSRELKIDYTDNFETKYKNHIGECKFFEYSKENIPCQPTFITFRFDLE